MDSRILILGGALLLVVVALVVLVASLVRALSGEARRLT